MNEEREPLATTGSRAAEAPCPPDVVLWGRRESDGSVTIGMTDVGQRRTGPVVHWRGPTVGTVHRKGEPVVSLESEKWVGHLAMPFDGTIVATNEALYGDPSAINRDPFGHGWLYRARPHGPEEFDRSELAVVR